MRGRDLAQRTVADFGDQWARYADNSGYYGSVAHFEDTMAGLIGLNEFEGARVAEIGSGTGRIVKILAGLKVARVHAVEPAPGAFETLCRNTEPEKGVISYMNAPGDALPPGLELDLALSIGVIHHIPDPRRTMRAMFDALKPGGRCLVWLYAREGNELYLSVVGPLRRLTVRLPHWALALLCHVLNAGLDAYIAVCRFAPLPMRHYVRSVLRRLQRDKRYLVLYDQLNPAYAKYYTEREARGVLEAAGFIDVRARHRHGYSWTVIGTKPHETRDGRAAVPGGPGPSRE
jgi:SAM-dependent methyltransferase